MVVDRSNRMAYAVGAVQESEADAVERASWERPAGEWRQRGIRSQTRFGRVTVTPARKRARLVAGRRPLDHPAAADEAAKPTWKSTPAAQPPSLAQAYVEEAGRVRLARRYAQGQARRLADPGRGRAGDRRTPYRRVPRGSSLGYLLHGSGALGGGYWGNAPSAPAAVPQQQGRWPSLFNRSTWSTPFGGPWYGNYVGPTAAGYSAGRPDAPLPLTPVDRAAWRHDYEYGEIYRAYGFDERAHRLGWFGNLTSLDPAFQLELAWSDLKLIGRSWGYMTEGLFEGFYRSERFVFGGEHVALGMDLAWAVGITATHMAMIATRLTMVGVGVAYHGMRFVTGAVMGLGDWIGGDVGRLVSSIGGGFDSLVVGVGQAVGLAVGLGGLVLMGMAGLGALAVAMPAVIVGGVVGSAVDAVGDVLESAFDGCFITEAALQSGSNESDDGAVLTALRGFRDEYVLTQPEGRRLMATYYATAPEIVRRIDARADRADIWRDVYERWLRPAVEAVRHDQPKRALVLYDEMLAGLCTETGVAQRSDSSRWHWKRDPMLGA